MYSSQKANLTAFITFRPMVFFNITLVFAEKKLFNATQTDYR